MSTKVDVNVPRFNQALVAILVGVAFVATWPWLVAVVAVVLAVSVTFGPKLAPFTQLYVRFLRPKLQPRGPTEFEEAAPPRFAQLLGTIFLTGSALALFAGATVLGWTLALLVTALATLAATARICVGCIIYEKARGLRGTAEGVAPR